MFGFDRITCDGNTLGGKACVRGLRISVSLIVNLVASGMSTRDIPTEYPDLEAEDIRQDLQYAAGLLMTTSLSSQTERGPQSRVGADQKTTDHPIRSCMVVVQLNRCVAGNRPG